MFWVSRKNRLPLTIALLVGLIVLGTILAHTRHADASPGRIYSGTVHVTTPGGRAISALPISFKINRAGDRAEDFHFSGGLPRTCTGTSVGSLDAAASAAITTPSKFLARIPIERDGSRVGTLIVDGVFHTLNREDGAVQTTFSGAGLNGCAADGSYSTKF